MTDMDVEIRKAAQLRDDRLINAADFAAKKSKILARPLRVSDFKDNMDVAKKLLDERLLTQDEYEVVKKRVLEIGE
jgi:hypothetical protein